MEQPGVVVDKLRKRIKDLELQLMLCHTTNARLMERVKQHLQTIENLRDKGGE